MSENGFSPNTIRAYRSDIVGFLTSVPGLGGTNTDGTGSLAVTEACAKNYLNINVDNWTPRTMKRKASALRAWGRFLGDPKFLSDYRLPKPARPVPHPVPEGVDGILDMIIETKGLHHRALIALCGLGGLRVGEALVVETTDIDWRNGTLLVKGKGNKQRIVPMAPLLQTFLKAAFAAAEAEGRTRLVPISDRGARAFITRAGRRASLSAPVSSHDLRSTFLTEAYRKTKDLRAVQELAGHASSETTEGYTGISMDAMRAAAAI